MTNYNPFTYPIKVNFQNRNRPFYKISTLALAHFLWVPCVGVGAGGLVFGALYSSYYISNVYNYINLIFLFSFQLDDTFLKSIRYIW